jgi:asparagine synthase (glutamine-hydrolysing)
MSAIIGRVNLDGAPVETRALDVAMSAISAYGQDGSERLVVRNAGFGVQKLNLGLGPSSHLNPIRYGPLLITADAIVNNQAELRRLLGKEAQEANDTQLLLQSFAKWGSDCAEHIFGDFSFAVFNEEEERLYLFRDHIGIRPLYWTLKRDAVLFATDLRGILAWAEFDFPINTNAVARHIMGPARPANETFFAGIHLLKPGTVLCIDQSGVKEWRWWDPMEIRSRSIGSRQDHVVAFRELMERIGKTYTTMGAKIGTHISGGIDSCSTAAFAARALKQRGQSITAGYAWAPAVSEIYPIDAKDERKNIATVAKDLGFPVRYGQATGQSQLEYLSWPLELQGLANLSDEAPVLQQAEADGIRVMLSGWGGDEAYSAHGMGFLAYALKRGHLQNALTAMRYYTGGLRSDMRRTLRSFLHWGLAPLMPSPIYCRLAPFEDLHKGGAFPSAEIQEVKVPQAKYNGEDVRLVPDPNIYVASLLNWGHLNMRMETWAAWSAPHAYQYRYPLLDRELLEFVVGMPPGLFFGDGRSRFLARAVTTDLLPKNLSKHDQANEVLRDNNHIACWNLLKQDLARGVFDEPSDWLDMSALTQTIRRVPDSVQTLDLAALAKLMAAVRVYHMEQRLKTSRRS